MLLFFQIMLELLFGCTAHEGLPSTDMDLVSNFQRARFATLTISAPQISYVEENEDATEQYHSCWQQNQLSLGEKLQALAEHCTEHSMKRRPSAQQVSQQGVTQNHVPYCKFLLQVFGELQKLHTAA